ncbi:MAG: TonB-dependent receptor [Gammaproteobacteria bacterium]|nr:TonB-dependent receptor [Gammaproteobacteria bacterium]
MNKKFIVTLPLLLLSISAHAGDMSHPEMAQSLQNDMQEYSRIATQTKQNVDYMPYIISAWNSDELSQLGISTLREALSLVPGVGLSIGTVGTTIPIFRGSNPFAVGQSKLVIDGIVVNDKMKGDYSHLLDIPVTMIQRIEVVRGPGSLLSYVNGYSGSIHVITKANRDDGLSVDDEVFAELGSDGYKTGGFITSYKENDFSISSDLFYKTHDQKSPVVLDRYGNSGDSQQWLDNYSFGINAHYNNFNVKGRLTDRESGASYGQAFSLSEDESDYVAIENNYIELGYSADISKGVIIDLSFGYIELKRQLKNKVIPDNPIPVPPGPPLPNGKYLLVDLKEETVYERIELEVSTFDSHNIHMGVYAYQSDMAKRDAFSSIDGMQTVTAPFDILIDTPRNMYSAYVDDLINFSEQTSIQIGVKYDHYSDVESQASPRIALVHRYDNENIYKFMYTHSYREPSWREQYLSQPSFFSSTLDVRPEQVDAYELGYIRKLNLKSHIKFNTYLLSNKDQIHAQNPTHTFQNNGDNNLYGYEIEYKNELGNNDQIYFNYSYVDGENVADQQAGSARTMVKSYYIHKLNHAFSVSAIAKFVGEKGRVESDLRDNIDSYALFDLSANYQNKSEKIDINLSVKNLFDETYYLPSPENTYPVDFEQEGRSILLSLRKRF